VKYELPKWYVAARKAIEDNITSKNYKGIIGKFPSPCGDFTFVIEHYQKSHKGWNYNYYVGKVLKGNDEILKITSSAYKFWHCWIKQEDGLYLLCNEDIHGYSIVDVKSGKTYTYIDPKAKDGWGFSWKEVVPSPDGKTLAVQGDYQEATKEVALYDLTNMTIPLRKVKSLRGNFALRGWCNKKIIIEKRSTLEMGT
jgi:hypothetical protein